MQKKIKAQNYKKKMLYKTLPLSKTNNYDDNNNITGPKPI